MPTWLLTKKNGSIQLTYQAPGTAPQHCGSGDERLAKDVLAWCIDSAAVADTIIVEGEGVFVRMAAPTCAGRVIRS